MCVGENLRGKKSVEVKKADLRKIRGQRPAGRSFGSESPRDGPVERRGGREGGRQGAIAASLSPHPVFGEKNAAPGRFGGTEVVSPSLCFNS